MLIKRGFFSLTALLILTLPLYAEEGHNHEGHHDHGSSLKSETKHDMGSHSEHQHGTKTEVKTDYDYIRVDTPAGYNAVIGRKNPLPELKPIVTKDKDGNPVKEYTLTVEDVRFEIFPGKFIMGWGFNGSIPGPTIRVKEGDIVRITLMNNTDTEHTLHVHGQKKRIEADGVPYVGQKPVFKGESYTYEFIADYPGTHWYHCHVDTTHHVDMGMYGAFIVEPKNQRIEYDREYIMILDEWPTAHVHIHKGMNMEGHEEHGIVTEHPGVSQHEHPMEKPQKRDWYPETYLPYQPVYDGFTINGRSFPFTEPLQVKEGEKVLIRIINAGYQSHFIHSHSHKFRVVARSGSPVNEPQKIDTVEIGAGNRVDILLYADNPGIWPFHCHRLDHITNEHIYPGGMLTFIQYMD
jgi:FtsP/CotA-like multicopper oxidase with cupredoxin domain